MIASRPALLCLAACASAAGNWRNILPPFSPYFNLGPSAFVTCTQYTRLGSILDSLLGLVVVLRAVVVLRVDALFEPSEECGAMPGCMAQVRQPVLRVVVLTQPEGVQ